MSVSQAGLLAAAKFPFGKLEGGRKGGMREGWGGYKVGNEHGSLPMMTAPMLLLPVLSTRGGNSREIRVGFFPEGVKRRNLLSDRHLPSCGAGTTQAKKLGHRDARGLGSGLSLMPLTETRGGRRGREGHSPSIEMGKTASGKAARNHAKGIRSLGRRGKKTWL